MPSVIALDAMGSDRAPKPEIEGAIQAARQYGVRVLLVIGDSQVRRLFALTGMDSVIEVYPSVEDALAGGSARS